MKGLVAVSIGKARRIGLVLLLCAITAGCTLSENKNKGNILTDHLSEPLNEMTSAKYDIDTGDGNLTIDWLRGNEQLLAGGTLQYMQKQGQPERTLKTFLNEATLTLRGGKGWRSFRLPWAACNAATEWHLDLNPTISSDITAHSNGGNIELNLAGMTVTHVSADTGGGNVNVVLPDHITDLSVSAQTGAGNVNLSIPSDVAARIHATTALGKVNVDPRFQPVGDNTYQSPDFDNAVNKVEITANSGAGNVSINVN